MACRSGTLRRSSLISQKDYSMEKKGEIKGLKHHIGLGVLLAMLLMPLSLCAQADAASEYPEELGINEVVQLSLGNHFQIAIGKIELEQAEQNTAIQKAPFETTAEASVTEFRDSSTNPQDYPYSAKGVQQSLTLQRQFSTGTSIQLSADSTRYEDLEIPRSGEVSLQVSQRLLKGRGLAYNLAPVRIAARQRDITREALRQTVIDTITEAQFAYYDGLLAESYVDVSKESLELAKQLLAENQRRAEIGSIASSDLLQAEAEVALRQETLYQAEVGLTQSKNRMKRILSDRVREVLDWHFSYIPLGDPEKRGVQLLKEYEVALSLRPDYRQAVLNLEIGEINKLRESNAALPSVDLYAQMSYEGWGDSLDKSFREALDQEKPDYMLGVSVSRPILNRAARASKWQAALETNRLQLTLNQLEQAILLDLDDAAAQIDGSWKRFQSAKQGRILAEKSLEAEQKRYQTGTSSTFILIRLQTDLINARMRELIAVNDYRKSLVEFDRQTGMILDLHHIEVPE